MLAEPQKQRAPVLPHMRPPHSRQHNYGEKTDSIVTHGAIDLVLGRLEKVRQTGPGRWMACCSAHTDRNPSLQITLFDTGVIGLHCFARRCEVADVVSSMGLRMEDLFPPRPHPGGGRPPERKPYSVRQLVDALNLELHVAWVLLADVSAGKDLGEVDRHRAGTAAARCAMLLEELRHAR